MQCSQDKLQTQRNKGYFRPLCAVVLVSLRWAVALVPATLLSLFYAILAFPLWLCGLWGIIQWWEKRAKDVKTSTLESPDDIVSKMNEYPNDGNRDPNYDNPNFRVNDLVKMTSGLDMEELVTRSRELELKRRDAADVVSLLQTNHWPRLDTKF